MAAKLNYYSFIIIQILQNSNINLNLLRYQNTHIPKEKKKAHHFSQIKKHAEIKMKNTMETIGLSFLSPTVKGCTIRRIYSSSNANDVNTN